jgi:hypothetical protein
VVKNAKFTQVINPLLHPEITYSMSVSPEDEIGYRVSASIESGSEKFAKLSLLLIKQGS